MENMAHAHAGWHMVALGWDMAEKSVRKGPPKNGTVAVHVVVVHRDLRRLGYDPNPCGDPDRKFFGDRALVVGVGTVAIDDV